MLAAKSERRRSPRVFFLKREDITFGLKKPGEEEALFHVLVKDLSLAGIGFMLKRTEPVRVRPGDRLMISAVHNSHGTAFLAGSTLQVEWVLDTEILDHIGFGCSFRDLEKTIQAKLEKYISALR